MALNLPAAVTDLVRASFAEPVHPIIRAGARDDPALIASHAQRCSVSGVAGTVSRSARRSR
jgi:hypothetical protein